MREEYSMTGFGVLNYCVFGGMVFFSVVTGLYSSYVGNRSPEEFLMGNRSFGSLSITLSLLASLITPVVILGYSGESYARGTQLSTFVIGVVLSGIFSMYVALPVLYPLKLTSINEYIHLRFKSKRLRLVISVLTVVKIISFNGVSLYAPTIALSSVTKLETFTLVLILGIVCTIYSALGGIRAVVWTDVFQIIVIFAGLTLVVGIGFAQNGGLLETFSVASKGGRLEFFNMNLSPFASTTFFNTIMFGFFHYFYLYGTHQLIIQRLCTLKSIMLANRVLKHNLYGMLIFLSLVFCGGLVAYASYANCDPMTLGLIKKAEEIMPYLIVDRMSFIPGLPGIFIAALTAGTLSTLSSMMNSAAALMWKDIFLNFSYFQSVSARNATLINKVSSLAVGVAIIGAAVLASGSQGLVEISMTIFGTLHGSVVGVFLIGYLFPKCNMKGVWTGFIISFVIVLWIGVGALFQKRAPTFLSFSIDECLHLNLTMINATSVPHFNETSSNITGNIDSESSFVENLYLISKTLYGTISTGICILLALAVSFLTGNQSLKDTSPAYISPCIRKFYWPKETLEEHSLLEVQIIDSPKPEKRKKREASCI